VTASLAADTSASVAAATAPCILSFICFLLVRCRSVPDSQGTIAGQHRLPAPIHGGHAVETQRPCGLRLLGLRRPCPLRGHSCASRQPGGDGRHSLRRPPSRRCLCHCCNLNQIDSRYVDAARPRLDSAWRQWR
jgi:hypothetical protein